MTIAITGATGQLGQLAVQAIKARDPKAKIVALVRDPAKAATLGVELRAFDYTKPEGQVAALQGVDVLVLISSNEIGARFAQHANVIKSAQQAGVSRLIYTSLLRADRSAMTLLAGEHVQTEQALQASGLITTILRNGWYTENYLAALDTAFAHGAMIGSAGQGLIASAARQDYAEAIAVTALDAAHAGKVYELAGDSSYRMADLAAELAQQSGKPVVYHDLPQAEYAKALVGFGLPAAFAAVLAESDFATSNGALFDEGRRLSTLIGRPTTPFAASIAAALR